MGVTIPGKNQSGVGPVFNQPPSPPALVPDPTIGVVLGPPNLYHAPNPFPGLVDLASAPFTGFNPLTGGASLMPYRTIWQFQSGIGSTWEEVYFTAAGSALAAANVPGIATYNRLLLLHPSCLLQRVRAFNVAGGRDTATVLYNLIGKATAAGGPTGAPASLVVNLQGLTGRGTYHWWRGMPSAYVVTSALTGFPLFPSVINDSVTGFATSMASSQFGNRFMGAATPIQKFTNTAIVVNAALRQSTISAMVGVGQTAPAWQIGQRVVVAGASRKDLYGINGHFSLVGFTAPVANVFTYTLNYIPPNSAAPTVGLGYVKVESYNTIIPWSASSSYPLYYGGHTTRSVFSNSRGAKRAFRSRQLL